MSVPADTTSTDAICPTCMALPQDERHALRETAQIRLLRDSQKKP